MPGLFLLLNLLLAFYFLNPNDVTKSVLTAAFSNIGFSALVAIPVGYCLGVAVRLLRTSTADRWSARVMRMLGRLPGQAHFTEYVPHEDRFPYPRAFRKRVLDRLPEPVEKFYKESWIKAERKSESQADDISLVRFDFYKTLLRDLSPTAAKEIHAAEALCRYVANTLYSIAISGAFLLFVIVHKLWIGERAPLALTFPLAVYVLAVLAILPNLRFLRIYEVETVFALAFRYRDELAKIIWHVATPPLPRSNGPGGTLRGRPLTPPRSP